METAIQWIFSLLVAASPLQPALLPTDRDAQETIEERRARYMEISKDLARVVYAEDQKPLFGGDQGRAQTASVLVAWMKFESDFRKDVDFGIGRGRGDNGNSWCLMQLYIGNGKTSEGWTGLDVTKDRSHCFASGLNSMRRSFEICKSLPIRQRGAIYAKGSCDSEIGRKESEHRINLAMYLFKNHPPTFKDSDIIINVEDI